MDLGLHYWNFSAPGNPQRIADTLAAAAHTAEEAGFAEFSVMDHYFQQVEQTTGWLLSSPSPPRSCECGVYVHNQSFRSSARLRCRK